jgi:hypothetical protein
VPWEGDVTLHSSPWITGTRAQSYLGPITTTHRGITTETFARRLTAAYKTLERKAAKLGANAVVGVETIIDPWADKGIQIRIVGVAAKLEPLF